MASNRAQRRAANKKGKWPGETYADQLARQKNIKEAIEKAARDETVALESDIKTQRFLWMAVVANYEAFGHAGVRAQRFMWYAKMLHGGLAEEWGYVCSECGCTVSEKSGLGKYEGDNQQLHFCPNCGKPMGEISQVEGM